MNTINIMVGLPMSGKSEFVKDNKKPDDWVVSADDVRLMFTKNNHKYDAYDAKKEKVVWHVVNDTISHILKHREDGDVWIDNINCNVSQLKGLMTLINHYNEHNRDIQFYVVETEPSKCINRLNVGHEHMETIIRKMESGYDKVCDILKEWQKKNNEGLDYSFMRIGYIQV